jgi:hypothetical protein
MTEMPTVQPASATLLDIYARQVEISADLAVIREQLKAIPDHEQRIRILEASQAKLIGAAVAGSAIMSMLGTWIGLAIAHH